MKLMGMILGIILLASPTSAQDLLVGRESIAAYREKADAYQIGQAYGAFAALDVVLGCPSRHTVGEFRAWLRFSAEPTWTFIQAAYIWHYQNGCQPRSTSEMQAILGAPRGVR